MTFELFQDSLKLDSPPIVSDELKALWHDAKGDWDKAHELVQDVKDKDASWIHAYLHRKEGDRSNAVYWYNRAGKKESVGSLEKEWEEIVSALIN